jgi:hypothetical protein
MRVLSQSEIDNILSELLANPSVLPDADDGAGQGKTEKNENSNKPADS